VAGAALLLASSNGTRSAASTQPGAVTISNFKFLPGGATVAAGTHVSFVNRDSAPHTASASSAPALSPDGEDTATSASSSRSARPAIS